MGCFIFNRDPIYDIEGSTQAKRVKFSSSRDCFPCAWNPNGDMVTTLFHLLKYDLSQYTHDDVQSSLGSVDAHPFGDSYFLYEIFQPS